MKEINELNLPSDVRYAENHEWARAEGDKIIVGISDYAQDQLGDITFLDLPEVGDTFEQGEEFGAIESTKTLADLYMPVGGEILTVNEALEDSPELINQTPYTDGWILEIKPERTDEIDALMSRDQYLEMLEGLEEEE